MPIWGVVNQKGGVGKTTTAVNLSAGLADQGIRTLLIDADPQGNATTGLGIDKRAVDRTLFQVFQEVALAASEGSDVSQALPASILSVRENLDLVPATLDLAGAEAVLLNAVGKEMILRDAIEPVHAHYQAVVIDAPPSLGILTVNVLAACDEVIVPLQCEFYALEGLSQLMKTIEVVKRRINPRLEIGTVLLTMYDARNNLSDQVAEEVREFFGEKVAQTVIPRNVRLSEAPGFGEPAISKFPDSRGALAYRDLVGEVRIRCGVL